MPSKANIQKIFESEFKYYWKKKKPAGRKELREDPAYVLQVAGDYYKQAASLLNAIEIKSFFEWLARDEPYFADDHLFARKLKEWSSSRGERSKADKLPEGFANYINLYGVLAQWLSVHENDCRRLADLPIIPHSECPYHRINIICTNLPALHKFRKDFIGQSEEECFRRFYEWLRQVGIKDEHLTRMSNEIQKFDDKVNLTRGTG